MHKKSQKSKSKNQNFLSIILREKQKEIKAIQIASLQRGSIGNRRSNDSFLNIMTKKSTIAIIGELKFASPSAGVLGSSDLLEERVHAYQKAGVDAISVITEQHFFHGDTAFVERVKKQTSLPVLQKDFVIDLSQVFEAKRLGSDALLLIASIVNEEALRTFVDMCLRQEIEPVVEVHGLHDLRKALKTRTRVIAVNARNLNTFTVDVKKACRLLQKIPVGYVKLGFSGVLGSKEVALYKQAGAHGILIGTTLVKEVNVDAFLSSLRKQTR